MARTVVISGGGTGIGRAAAHAFADSGARVVLLGRRGTVLERAAERIPGAAWYAADLSRPEDVRRVADTIGRDQGAVDVLVHSAGGSGELEPPAEHTEPLAAVAEEWSHAFRLNVLTAVLLTEALRDRLATPGGRVLFLGSIAAYRGTGSRAGYAAAKAALHPYAFRLARELGPRGVTVNVVAPGLVEETDFFGGEPFPEDRLRERIAETATGRIGRPGDVAETLRWLASPAAGHITAQVIQVNGGAERGH
ncbi:SDR family NAD(P)-dependent oxidoreductase [Streptomyces clavuligerus]|nr:SDR family oxidoreductase [Streptomyces clavuligerus]ANW20640.1 oxidoreductase [Streptomyces clavuligerus]AXU15265.1 SDR family oxidoreductase [Streptomyces clavuligerus]EDY51108.1 3-oxoacyl-ACP reductase [Streptomyces clavuligerus]MBY6305342.1 SDR family oxidoreductase [Streptomyces clavuligerus]QCS08041.1 SDR family NAD(P)-dependent oxidoreductase [Streptomyces clavuligerus]